MITKTMNIFYKLPQSLGADIHQFEQDLEGFVRGEVNPVSFKALRVAQGVYEQRQLHTYMIRIRCAGGGITPAQLRRAAELGRSYGNGDVHLTTRQEIQLHDVLYQDLLTVIKELLAVGLSTRGGGGNTIRNILCPAGSGITKHETFDVSAYAMALTSKLIDESDSWNLPRKFKIAFSNDENDTAFTQATCLGFLAKKDTATGQKGFAVYCAGGMGAKPLLGNLLLAFVPDTAVYHVARALKTMFDKYGNRKSKTTSRIKFLWKRLQQEEFVRLFHQEYDKIKNDDSQILDISCYQHANKAELKKGYEPELLEGKETKGTKETGSFFDTFDIWKQRFVCEQKQAGLYAIKLPLRLGDISGKDVLKLCEFLDNFGSNCLRCDRSQNILIRNIPEAFLPNAFYALGKLEKTLLDFPAIFSNMINCTGASTCKLGICLPRGLSDAIRDRLASSSLDLDRLYHFRLNMSGCPNTCGLHHIAHLGFFGKVSRKKSDMYPAYNILSGARVHAGKTLFAQKQGELAAKQIPDFVHDFLEHYLLHMHSHADYYEYLAQHGNAFIHEYCQRNKETPLLSEDASFYFDYGAKKRLSLDEIGMAECSAGMFDMIGVDRKIIKEKIALLLPMPVPEERISISASKARAALLYQILFSSSRMLLVTQGLDAKNDSQVFTHFLKRFVHAGLVDQIYEQLLKTVIACTHSKDLKPLLRHESAIVELSAVVNKLYKSMDDSLRFRKDQMESKSLSLLEPQLAAKT